MVANIRWTSEMWEKFVLIVYTEGGGYVCAESARRIIYIYRVKDLRINKKRRKEHF